MASLRKKAGSKYFFACFTDADGRRHQRSTKATDRKTALRIAEQFEEAARNRRTAVQTRRVIADLHKQLTGEDLPSSSVAAYLETWLAAKRGTVESSTFVFYSNSIKTFVDFLGPDAEKDISEITERHIAVYRDHLASSLAPQTANHKLKTLRMVFQEAKRGGWIPDDPTEGVKALKRDRDSTRSRRPFTVEEIRRVLDACGDQWEWRSMVVFGLYTGQRLADLTTLRWSQIDLEHGEIAFTTRKTGRRVLVPICSPLRNHILGLPAPDLPDAPVHPSLLDRYTRAGKASTLSNDFANILHHAGLRPAKTSHRKDPTRTDGRHRGFDLSFHSLRHSAVSLLKNAGISPAIVQDIIGHDSPEISAHYTVIEREAKSEALSTLPDVTAPTHTPTTE